MWFVDIWLILFREIWFIECTVIFMLDFDLLNALLYLCYTLQMLLYFFNFWLDYVMKY